MATFLAFIMGGVIIGGALVAFNYKYKFLPTRKDEE